MYITELAERVEHINYDIRAGHGPPGLVDLEVGDVHLVRLVALAEGLPRIGHDSYIYIYIYT